MAERRGNSVEQGTSGWSIHLITVSGIPIRIHFTFFLLLTWLVFNMPGPSRLFGLFCVVGLFTCVVLHELGHSIVAQRLGVGVVDIVLYPIGGIARMEKMPAPKQELWIALAGPAVNVVISAVLWLAFKIGGTTVAPSQLSFTSSFWHFLLYSNVVLFAFNMIPAFPMDGGRVLRAVLAIRLGELRATELAATIGQFLAVVLGFLALGFTSIPYFSQFNPLLVFIAIFVFFGAGQEAQMYRGKALVEGLPVRAAMITDYRTLPVGASLGQAAELLLQTSQQDFPIVNGADVIGVLSRQNLLRGLAAHGPTGYVTEAMTREFRTVEPDGDLQAVATEMQTGEHPCVLVMKDDELLGFVTLENLAELLIVRQLTNKQKPAGNRDWG